MDMHQAGREARLKRCNGYGYSIRQAEKPAFRGATDTDIASGR